MILKDFWAQKLKSFFFQPIQDTKHSLILLDEIENLKEQTVNLKEAVYCCEEEKKTLQIEFQEKVDFINNLKLEIEELKSNYNVFPFIQLFQD